MEVETRERVKAAMNAVSVSVSGGKAFHEIAAGLLRGLDWARGHLQGLDTDEKVSSILDGLKEPSPEQLAWIEAIAKVLPAALYGLIREALKGGLAMLPGAKMGRKAVPIAEKIAICDGVAALTRSGCTLPVAKMRIGQRYEITARTVSRIWSKRGEYQTSIEPEQAQALLASLFYEKDGATVEGGRETSIAATE